jgi:predicted metalloprotease
MRWGEMRRSENVEDRSGARPRGGGIGGGGMKIGLGGIILVLIASVLFGINPFTLLGGMSGPEPAPQSSSPGYGPQVRPGAATKSADPTKEMVARVLGDTEDVWNALFQAMFNKGYPKPGLVIFEDQVRSTCGFASAAVGPFYCPGDGKVYLDTAFFDQLARRFGAPGDFAQAYVVAHEVGHHVQNVLGTMQQFDRLVQRAGPSERNALQVRLELQADCYAGVWGHFAQRRKLLEPGDLEEGLRGAAAVGDDQIMKRTQGYVVPDAFTHGSAQQRMYWFKRGLETGDPRRCDTFTERQP